MKFIHIADMHFDCPFTNLVAIEGLAQKRRLEQRQILKKVIQYIQQNKIELLFIAGDLYEQEYIRKTTIDYINDLFKQIPNTKIFITPGNHDPLIKNSYYKQYNWNENVYIFNSKINKISIENINIYGYGFEDFYSQNSGLEQMNIDEKDKINILITHASLDASKTEDMQYNAVSTTSLGKLGFDYIALGHIHKSNYKTNTKIVYPGSGMGLGFDELGEHGMIVGDINLENKKIEIEFIKLDETQFCEKEINVEEIFSDEELIEKINNIYLEKNNLYKIVLTGQRNYNIEEQKILKLINKDNILKIKNKSKIKYNLQEIAKEESLKGFFIKECLEKLETEQNKKIIQDAIEIGLELLES